MEWDDQRWTQYPEVDTSDPMLRAAAERVHRNESLHRHNPDGPVCIYCALNAARALSGLAQTLVEDLGVVAPGSLVRLTLARSRSTRPPVDHPQLLLAAERFRQWIADMVGHNDFTVVVTAPGSTIELEPPSSGDQP